MGRIQLQVLREFSGHVLARTARTSQRFRLELVPQWKLLPELIGDCENAEDAGDSLSESTLSEDESEEQDCRKRFKGLCLE